MYLEICEWLGLYGMATRSYIRKLSRERYRGIGEHRKLCRDWIDLYENEENRGIDILQRQRRLKEEEFMTATSLDEDRNRLKNNLSNYEFISDQ